MRPKCNPIDVSHSKSFISKLGNTRSNTTEITIKDMVKVGATEAMIGFFKSANVFLNVKNSLRRNNPIIKIPIKQKILPIDSNPSANNKFPNETVPKINPQIGIGIAFKKFFSA